MINDQLSLIFLFRLDLYSISPLIFFPEKSIPSLSLLLFDINSSVFHDIVMALLAKCQKYIFLIHHTNFQ